MEIVLQDKTYNIDDVEGFTLVEENKHIVVHAYDSADSIHRYNTSKDMEQDYTRIVKMVGEYEDSMPIQRKKIHPTIAKYIVEGPLPLIDQAGSKDERDILIMAYDGSSIQQIADHKRWSVRMADRYIQSVFNAN